jgi:hypothetical protein
MVCFSGRAAVGALGSEPNDFFLVIALQVLLIILFITLMTPLIQSAELIDFEDQLRYFA